MEATTLAALFKDNDLDSEVLQALAEKPFGLTSVKHFANFFETKGDVQELFLKGSKWKDDGTVVANVKQAWREAEAMVSRGLKRAADGLPEEAIDEPLRKPIEEGLKTTFYTLHGIQIPALWLGTPSLVGRLYRELQKRLSHTAMRMDKVKSVDQALQSGPPQLKRLRLANDVEVSLGEQSQPEYIGAIYQYTLKLKTFLFSLAYAGAWKVTEDSIEVAWVPLQLCLDHLANAEGFIARNSGSIPDHQLLRAVEKRDETVRSKWAELYRGCSASYGKVMKESEAFASTIWIADIVAAATDHSQRGGDGNRKQKQQQQQQQQGGGGRRIDSVDLTRTDSSAFLNGSPSRPLAITNAAARYGSKIKTCKTDPKKQRYCKAWNDLRNGSGCTVKSCSDRHACDVLLPSGKPCDGSHRRAHHTGATVPLE